MKIDNLIDKAILIREFEKKLLDLFSKGKLNGTVHTCIGQELTPVLISKYLKDSDVVFSNHRGHGHFLSRGGDLYSLMAEMLGKKCGISGGIGGSQHLMTKNFFSNGIQGGMSPISSGYAFANKKNNDSDITVCYIGDGTLGEGALYEAFSLSSNFNSPVLFVLENNGYAQSTPFNQTFQGSVEQRVNGFGLKFLNTNIWDLDDFDNKVKESVKLARSNTPVLIEVECYRLNSHSKGDDNRKEKEIEDYKKIDLLNKFHEQNPSKYNIIKDKHNKLLNDIVMDLEFKESLQYLPKHNYVDSRDVNINEFDYKCSKRINISIYLALKHVLNKNKDLYFLGEDIQNLTEWTEKEYGGAFKVSSDLSDMFPNRVLNTPICEAGIIGFGIGIALSGSKSLIEIMFGDFLTLGFDAILQQASKIPEMYGRNVSLPMIIRTPMGARRGYGPTHSQNIEKYFSFMQNVNLYAINSEIDIEKFYINAFNENKLTIIIEDKILYTKNQNRTLSFGYKKFITDEKFPTLIIENKSFSNCIVFCYGAMLDEVLDCLSDLIEEEIFPTIITPSSLSPMNLNPLVKALKHSKKLILINEGSKYGSISSEVLAYLNINNIDFDLILNMSNESIIPCSKDAELNVVPNSKLISKEIINSWK